MIHRNLTFLVLGAASLSIGMAVWAASVPENDWIIAGPFGGTALTVTVDPHDSKIVLAGAMNSLLFRSTDYGGNWTLLNFPKRVLSEVSSILVDPSDANHYLAGMMAAAGGGLFESHDQGSTWSEVKDIKDFGVRSITASASRPSRFVAGTLHGVMMSDDSGKTWARISDPQNQEMQAVTAVALDSQNPDIIYAGTSHLPWKTTDAGKTWQPIHDGMIDDSDVFSIYVNPAAPNEIFASACSGIYSSGDRGNLWKKLMGIPNTSRRTHVIRADPQSASTIYAGTTTGLFKSVNNGTSWRTLNGTQINHLTFDSSHPQTMYLALSYDGVGKSENGGEQINLINQGFVDRAISAVTKSGNKLIAIESQDGETTGIFSSQDQGRSWLELKNTRGLGGVHLKTISGVPSEDRILLAASPHHMYKSIDAGLTWKLLPVRLIVPPPVQAVKPATTAKTSRTTAAARQTGARASARSVKPKPTIREISPTEIAGLYAIKSGSTDLLFAATDLGLLKSDDMGEHWTFAELPGSTAVTGLFLPPTANGYLIARAAGGLYLSKDFGAHWAVLPFPLPSSDVNSVALAADPNAPILVGTRVGLYVSVDGGNAWNANRGGIPASTVNSVLYTGSELTAYAVEYGRLYQSTNGGGSWNAIPSALPSTRIRQLWMPDAGSGRLFGITGDIGIVYRN